MLLPFLYLISDAMHQVLCDGLCYQLSHHWSDWESSEAERKLVINLGRKMIPWKQPSMFQQLLQPFEIQRCIHNTLMIFSSFSIVVPSEIIHWSLLDFSAWEIFWISNVITILNGSDRKVGICSSVVQGVCMKSIHLYYLAM